MLYPITHTFLDGRNRYVAGETREISDEDVTRFRDNGWLDAPSAQDTPTLDIAGSGHTNTSEVL